MEKEKILELREIIYEKDNWPIKEVIDHLKEMADGAAISASLKIGRMKGWRMKRSLPKEDVFKLIYIVLEMTHDEALQQDPERATWKITQLEKLYL